MKKMSGIIFLTALVLWGSHARAETVPIYTYEVINAYPHDKEAFTQGLVFENGFLYEGTGQYGASSLRKVQLETGDILQIHRLPRRFFGEGITIYKSQIIQLTWRSGIGLIYNRHSLRLVRKFRYQTEGWGITHDGERLIMSDGTATLHFLDPETFKQIGRIQVHDSHRPVRMLNELEYLQEEIWANVWNTNRIARISPQTGMVLGWIDLRGLCRWEGVLNGIAYDAEHDRLFVTGKRWPYIYEIKIIPREK